MKGPFGGILLSVVDSLVKMARLVFIFKQQARQAVFKLKSMEECPILIIAEVDVQFLIPQDPSVSLDIDQFEVPGIANQIIYEANGAHQACPSPFGVIWVGYVQPSDGVVHYFRASLWNCSFDFLVVGIFDQ